MPSSPSAIYDVLIAGAGAVGLFLACELRLGGCSVLVLEAARDPHSPLKEPPFGVRGLSVPTIESLDRRGLLDGLKDRAANSKTPGTAHWLAQPRRPGGHFAGIPFFHDQIDTSHWRYRLPGEVGNLAVDMAGLETVLTARAEALGVEIRRGCAVEGLEQSDGSVVVRAGGEAVASRWLVGCDGARSVVRKAAGIGFTGTEPEFTGYSVEVGLADPGLLTPGRQHTATGMVVFNPPGTIAMVDFDGGAFHRTSPIGREHVEAVLRKVSGADVRVTALHLATTWTDRAYRATQYRRGRVLVAGDAAHIHSPLGGQGLNLGLGDAMNLGWKLAATIRGDAPEELVDTYESERQPVADRVLDWSRAQVALMRPSPSSRALQAVVRDLIATRDGATYFAEQVWGVGLRYDLGCEHPLAGRSAPDFTLADGTRFTEHLRGGQGALLVFEARPDLREAAACWGGRIAFLEARATEHLPVKAALVRPDGVVGWACGDRIDRAELEQAMARWFGKPADVARLSPGPSPA
ncbi:FAD-dependent monooxygenase [Aureimonas sp. AU20]|uniref:FAD-dependent monooxygenase n=1 Tax=Aureimonas sp. AU20 TaxID=1349819 RepID=UPI0007209924|nr:FAD-dependent monooxygenase [Aureimonas sp. AU20]ALN72244.1 hypothetical protein M673_05920 [Aureimonas sp. AU20]